jgi:hypothetical protein
MIHLGDATQENMIKLIIFAKNLQVLIVNYMFFIEYSPTYLYV